MSAETCADCGNPILGIPVYFMGTSARCFSCYRKNRCGHAKPWDVFQTEPDVNILQGDYDSRGFVLACMAIRKEFPGSSLVAIHQAKLGRQSYCATFVRRYWVWEVPGLWRVYVSNRKGISFEVPAGCTPERALRAWLDYKTQMGVP